MPNKQIYLTEELMKESKNIPNFSELIQRLFKDYLQTKKSKEELIKEKEKIEAEAKRILREQETNLTKITEEVKKVETIEQKTQEAEEMKEHKIANKISDCMSNCKDLFNIEITAEQAEEYVRGHWNSIKEYLMKKRLWHEDSDVTEQTL